MALKWIEGFELYEGGGTPPDHFSYKYYSINQSYGLDTTTGRFFGKSLRLGKSTSGSPDSFRTPLFTAQSTWIVGMNIARATSGVDGVFLNVYDGSTLQLEFRIVGADIKVYRNGATLIHTFTSALSHATDTRWHHLQIKFTIDTSSGSVGIKVDNGTESSQGSLNTDHTATGDVDTFGWASPDVGSNSYNWYIDDIYILDNTGTDNNDYLGALVVEGIRPTSNGTYSEWTPSEGTNYQNVDDNNEANYNSATATNEFSKVDTYAFGDLTAIDEGIKGVQVNGFLINTGTTNPLIQFRTVISGNNHNGVDNEVANTSVYDHYGQIWEDNPNTNADWTKTELDAAEFGVELFGFIIS